MNNRLKKVAITVLIVIGVLMVAAVVLGVLNALLGGGNWTFGWQDYRYDETGYTVGQGTVPVNRVTAIDLDWIDGEVEVLLCHDTFISLTETSAEELSESARLRWMVDTDGTLHIKYRKSSWFFGIGSSGRDKKLTLRIPEAFLSDLQSLDIQVESSEVSVRQISAASFSFESASGDLTVADCDFGSAEVDSISGDLDLRFPVCPAEASVSTVSGDVILYLPDSASFALAWDTVSGKFSHDFALSEAESVYTHGSGGSAIRIETVSGDLVLGALQ